MTGPQSAAVRDVCYKWSTSAMTDDEAKHQLREAVEGGHWPGWGPGNVGLAITRHTRRWPPEQRARFIALCQDVNPDMASIVERWFKNT